MAKPPRPTRADIERAAAALLLDILSDYHRVLQSSNDIMPIALAERLTPVMRKANIIMRLIGNQLEAVDLQAANAMLEKSRGRGKIQ